MVGRVGIAFLALAIAGCHQAGAPLPLVREGGPSVSARSGFLPAARPEDVGLRAATVKAFVDAGIQAQSGGLVLIAGGKIVVQRELEPGRAPYLASVGKVFTGLAIAFLRAEGKITSLDMPLSTWFPSWREGAKGRVTLRHALTHTTGAAPGDGPDGGFPTRPRPRDYLAYAVERPMAGEPGRAFAYNNQVFMMLGEVVRQVAGMPLDAYLHARLFTPLGIRSASWLRD